MFPPRVNGKWEGPEEPPPTRNEILDPYPHFRRMYWLQTFIPTSAHHLAASGVQRAPVERIRTIPTGSVEETSCDAPLPSDSLRCVTVPVSFLTKLIVLRIATRAPPSEIPQPLTSLARPLPGFARRGMHLRNRSLPDLHAIRQPN